MDTVNSLGQNVEGFNSLCNPRNFDNTTEITRQHKDRFLKRTNFQSDVGGTLYRLIDKESEGIVPEKQKKHAAKLEDKNDPSLTASHPNPAWYLVYLSQSTPTSYSVNAVDVYLVPEASPWVVDHINPSTGDWKVLDGITSVDRTDSKLIKIIKLPYCPIDYKIVRKTGQYAYDFDQKVQNNYIWQVVDAGTASTSIHRLKCAQPQLLDLTFTNFDIDKVKLGREDIADVELEEFTYNFQPYEVVDNADPNVLYESKLFHSDFYQKKLVYDSFSKQINLEDFYYNRSSTSTDPTTAEKPVLAINFKPTATINSKFGFSWNVSQPAQANVKIHKADNEDYDDLLLITRNNELTIYNSAYLDYIKTGYNYDKKANALQIEAANRNAAVSTAATALSTIGTIASFALAGPTGGASIPVGIGLATTTTATGINTVNQWANVNDTQTKIENSMQSKLAQLAAQATSTSGTDDVDLMTWYSGNRLSVMEYEAKPYMKTKIYNTLKNTGYSSYEIGTPNVDSRYWYNFIQCTPHIKFEGILNTHSTWVNDLKQRYQNGVSVFHHHAIAGEDDQTWTFGREYENWEAWLL